MKHQRLFISIPVIILIFSFFGCSAIEKPKEKGQLSKTPTVQEENTTPQVSGIAGKGHLGISIQDLTPDLIKSKNIQEGDGVFVEGVSPNSPAFEAGIKKEDIILEFNRYKIRDTKSLAGKVVDTRPGTIVPLLISRGGNHLFIAVKIGTQTDQFAKQQSTLPSPEDSNDLSERLNPSFNSIQGPLGHKTFAQLCDETAASPFNQDSKGVGVLFKDLNPNRAIPPCRKALAFSPNTLRLQFQLGRALQKAKNFTEALKWYRKAAASGYAPAQSNLGVMYIDEQGVKQDYKQARELFSKAANQGLSIAQSNLGGMYLKGRGGAQNFEKARYWYSQSAQQGFADAQYNLGDLLLSDKGGEKDLDQAHQWFLRAAEQKHIDAQYSLGWLYSEGKGVIQDYQQARKWYLNAAKAGHDIAQNNLGTLYFNGKGGPRDFREARHWYLQAAEQGNPFAQTNVGDLLLNGQGGPQNPQQARHWYLQAAEQGNVSGQVNLGYLLATGQGGAPDYQKAREWFLKAAEKGEASAQFNLGVLYSNGNGVPQNDSIAESWMQKAAAQGFAKAQEFLEETSQIASSRIDKDDFEESYNFNDSTDWSSSSTNQADQTQLAILKILGAGILELGRRDSIEGNDLLSLGTQFFTTGLRNLAIQSALEDVFPNESSSAINFMVRFVANIMEGDISFNSFSRETLREGFIQELAGQDQELETSSRFVDFLVSLYLQKQRS